MSLDWQHLLLHTYHQSAAYVTIFNIQFMYNVLLKEVLTYVVHNTNNCPLMTAE